MVGRGGRGEMTRGKTGTYAEAISRDKLPLEAVWIVGNAELADPVWWDEEYGEEKS